MSTTRPLKGKALVRAEEWRAAMSDLERYRAEPDARRRIDMHIRSLVLAIKADEPKWGVGNHRTSAAVAREVVNLCRFSQWAGVWPNGLLDVLRLVLNVPATATMTTDGNHTDTQTPQMRAVAEYWHKNPEASAYRVGQHVRNSRGNPLGGKGVEQLLDPDRHPGFAEHVQELRATAKKRKATRKRSNASPGANRRRATT